MSQHQRPADQRTALCDALAAVAPTAPTLCEGWTAADLAAHLVVRERRPDAALGILAAPFERHGDKVRDDYAARPFDQLVESVRSGPPTLSAFGIPGVDRMANTMEYFIHFEDLRRANGMGPRALDPGFEDQLWDILRRMSKMMLRKSPAGITLATPDGRRAVARTGDDMVTITGDVGELALFAYGRKDAAEVELSGPDGAVEAVRAASFGI